MTFSINELFHALNNGTSDEELAKQFTEALNAAKDKKIEADKKNEEKKAREALKTNAQAKLAAAIDEYLATTNPTIDKACDGKYFVQVLEDSISFASTFAKSFSKLF